MTMTGLFVGCWLVGHKWQHHWAGVQLAVRCKRCGQPMRELIVRCRAKLRRRGARKERPA